MINSELLKEAIADAKAVRATALANAKAALEEAFAPRFEAMFAEKLKEESEEEQEEGLQEVEAPNQVSGKGGEAKGPATKPVSKGQPKTPKGGAGDTDFKAVQVGLGPKDVPKLGKKVNETAEEEEEEGKKMDESGLTSEDLDEIIKELENEVADEEEGEKVDSAPIDAEVPTTTDDVGAATDGEGIPSTDDVGAATDGEGMPPEGGEVNLDLGTGDKEEVPPAGMNAGGLDGGAEVPPAVPPAVPQDQGVPADDDENINLEELLAALNEEAEEEEEEEEEGKEMDETLQNQGIPTNELAGQDKSGGVKGYPTAPQDASKKQLKGKNHNISGAGNIGTGATGGKPVSEVAQYKGALKEAYKTIEYLRGQINEVSLLNAKLLYTNKLFKEFADVLDDSYRMNIVEKFDLTKNVREVKLAYAILTESLSFGKQVAKVQQMSKPAAKPAPASKGLVKQITEGFASKAVSSTKPSQLITEGNEMALRFKKLAGIKEAPKTSEKR